MEVSGILAFIKRDVCMYCLVDDVVVAQSLTCIASYLLDYVPDFVNQTLMGKHSLSFDDSP